MLGLVRLCIVPEPVPYVETLKRRWLIFFSDTDHRRWWSRFLRPGFRHVSAAAWFATEERWVYFNPTARGLVIEIATDADFGPRFQQLVERSAAILAVHSAFARTGFPATFYCVGAIKALLGIKARALSPLGLFRHLLATGAEVVERPREEDLELRQPITPSTASCSGRGSVDHSGARGPEAARRGRQDPRDAVPAQA